MERGDAARSRLRPVLRWYGIIAVLFFNTCLLFVGLNLVASVVLRKRNHGRQSPRSSSAPAAARPAPPAPWFAGRYSVARVSKAYPGWEEDDVARIGAEMQTISHAYEPYTQFKPKPVAGNYVNVHESGFRVIRDQGPWPPDPAACNVFVFGGSTAFGIGVPDEETIASFLQGHLSRTRVSRPVRVYNFGRTYYFSSQERVLFEQLLASAIVPDLAVFVDGLNDFYFWRGIPMWRDEMARFMSLEFTNTLTSRLLEPNDPSAGVCLDFVGQLSIGKLLGLSVPRVGVLRPLPVGKRKRIDSEPAPSYDDAEAAGSVIARWQRNRRLIQCACSGFGVQPVFVWQPVPTYKYDLRGHNFYTGDLAYFRRHQRSRYGYALMDEERKKPAKEGEDDLLWLGGMQESRKENLYVDSVHYTSAFSDEIASRISQFVSDKGLLAKASGRDGPAEHVPVVP